MHHGSAISTSNRGPLYARQLAPGLLGLAGLLVLCLPVSAQPIVAACESIKAACEGAGFVFGGSRSGTGLWLDCVSPIVEGQSQRQESSLPLPQVDRSVASACKASDPDYAARHIVPAGAQGAAPPAFDDEYDWQGDTYGWYDDGWDGPGWYIVGDEFRPGVGFGGREGFHGWHHRGSHSHGGKHAGGKRGGERGGKHAERRGKRGGAGHVAGGRHGGKRAGGRAAHAGGAGRRGYGGGYRGGIARTGRVGGYHYGGGVRRFGGGGFHFTGGRRRSDIRLKHDIVMLGRLANGLGFYRFSYNGSDKAYVGVMAQEVQAVMPEAVVRGRDGYLQVYYDRLGLRMQTWDEWVASGQKIPTTAAH